MFGSISAIVCSSGRGSGTVDVFDGHHQLLGVGRRAVSSARGDVVADALSGVFRGEWCRRR